MRMLARRLLLLAAVLMLLTALAAGLAPQPDDGDPPPSPPPSRTPDVVEESISAEQDDQSVPARVGDLIRLEVTGDLIDQVQIERLDRIDPIEPTTPARFEIIPETAGVYPIRLVDADRRIGRLDIKP
jgi:hypothetical protein